MMEDCPVKKMCSIYDNAPEDCNECCEDYNLWVNEFEAHHPKYGKVWGDFEDKVYADSEEGFQHFYKNHRPEPWDYLDI